MNSFFSFKRVILLLCFLLLGTYTSAQAWQRINPKPFETSVQDCQLLSQDKLVAVGSRSCVLISENFGETWNILYEPGGLSCYVELRAVSFINENVGWAVGTNQSIISTQDGGESWTLLMQGSNYYHRAYNDVEFINDTIGFIIHTGNVLLKTIDAGFSWDTVPGLDTCSFDQVQFVSDSVGYLAGDPDYILKTDNGGTSWNYQKVEPYIEDLWVYTIHFINTDTGFLGGYEYTPSDHTEIILKTTNGGQSWQEVSRENWCSSEQFFFIDENIGYSIGYVVYYSNNIMRTIDGGDTWEVMTDHIGAVSLDHIVVNAMGEGICLGDNGQYFKSYDFGSSWENSSTYPFLYKKDVLSSFAINESEIIAYYYGYGGGVPADGVIKSYDGGNTWAHYDSLNYFNSMYFLNDSIGFYLMEGTNRLYRTSDNGVSWSFTEIGNSSGELLKIQFVNDSLGFLGGTKYNDWAFSLYKTSNQGIDWVEIDHELFEIVDIHQDFGFFNDSTGIVVGMMMIYPWDSSAHILKTYDQGLSWEMDTLDYDWDFIRAEIIDENTALLLSWERMCKTTDQGNNWYQIDFDYSQYISHETVLSFGSDSTAYLYVQGPFAKLFRTDDIGDHWYEVECPSTAEILTMSFISAEEGLLFGEDGVIFKTYTGGIVKVHDFPDTRIPETTIKYYPNPFTDHITFDLNLERISNTLAVVYNLEGKLISAQYLSANTRQYIWDGCDETGSSVPPGIYICRFFGSGYKNAVKIIKM